MSIHPAYTWTFIGASVLLTYLFAKRMKQTGCVTYIYVGLVIFCINLMGIGSWTFLAQTVNSLLASFKSGAAGRSLKEKVELLLTMGAASLFSMMHVFLVAGIIRYAIGRSMEGFYAIVSSVAFYFLIPVIMIGFDIMLVYAIFYGNKVPWFATALLVFFVLMLSLAIVGYLRMIFTKGKPTMRRVGPNRWEGDWEDNHHTMVNKQDQPQNTSNRTQHQRDTDIDSLLK